MSIQTELELTNEERNTLIKFRRRVSDILKPYHDDYFLIRWLTARHWNIEAAEKMIKDSLKWREKWKVDEIDKWEPSEVLIKYYPFGHIGYDKEGSPVIIVPFYGLDIVGMVHTVARSDFIKMTIKLLEKMLKIAHDRSIRYGLKARKLVVIFDMDNFTLTPFVWRPAGELVVAMIKIYEANYPEILKAAYVINATRIFSVGFAIIKKFLNEHTISKIHIYKNDPSKWKPVLLEKIHEDQLPVHFGGKKTDENGDPKCSAIICYGGKIPKSYYRDKLVKDDFDETKYDVCEIKKGRKVCFDFSAPSAGYILKWQFHTQDHDIKFGIIRLDPDGSQTEEVPLHRIKWHGNDTAGILTSTKKTTYRVVFDNSYSLLRSKRVHYIIQIFSTVDPDVDIPP